MATIYKTLRHHFLEEHNLHVSPHRTLRSEKYTLFMPDDALHIAVDHMATIPSEPNFDLQISSY